MKSLFWLRTGAALVVSSSAPVAFAAPTGHLAYVKGDKAIVADARTGRETVLPGAKRANHVAISPRGEALYFVARPGQPNDTEGKPPLSDGLLARPPYRTPQKLPGLAGIAVYNAYWSTGGSSFDVLGQTVSGTYSLATRRLQRSRTLPMSRSRNGRVLAYADDETIKVKDAKTGRERVIFSIKKPQPLFTALAAAKTPKGVKDLRDGIDPELWKNPYNWRMSAVALEASGKRLYFAANAGTSAGAAGNTTWALFTCDLATGKIAVLSKVGMFFSRPPEVLEVSPDAQRLLVLSSAHSSAVDNPSSLFVIDLLTQNSRELLLKQTPKSADSNLANGACWSPDSKYIAFSATYYSTSELLKRPSSDWNPKAEAWRLFIADAATGKVARTVIGGVTPSWGR